MYSNSLSVLIIFTSEHHKKAIWFFIGLKITYIQLQMNSNTLNITAYNYLFHKYKVKKHENELWKN